jgi:hypothetical protein
MTTKIKTGTVAFLIESELERASLVLAAKDITNRLQRMAEDLAKIEANDIMPILDQLREVFGAEASEQFNTVATAKVRTTIESIKDAKQGIGAEIDRLEKGVGGGVVPNDMALGGAPVEDPAADPLADPEADPLAAASEELPADDMGDAMGTDGDDFTDADAAGVVPGLEDLASVEDESPMGRPRKESAKPRGNALAEAKDPDALVLKKFRARLAEGARPLAAVRDTARTFSIDVEDVVRIVTEAKARRKVSEATVDMARQNTGPVDIARKTELQKLGYSVTKGPKGFYWSKPQGQTQQDKPEIQDGTANNENDAWAALDATVKANSVTEGKRRGR